MISFHPTLSPLALAKYVWQSKKPADAAAALAARFPDHQVALTDSGRSAFALIVETLDLRGKTIVFPAFVCDSYYPVLKAYDITPIFLDVDEDTFQPARLAYTDAVLSEADAIVLVATYGRVPSPEVVSHLGTRGLTVIEDYAMRSPLLLEPLVGAARLYSLPKTLPVPDGGLAILPKSAPVQKPQSAPLSLGFIKNVLKLLPGVAPFIARLRNAVQSRQATPHWAGIRDASTLTRKILTSYSSTATPFTPRPYPYCYPLRSENLKIAAQKIRAQGLSPERIWQRPIVHYSEARADYHLDPAQFPVTSRLAEEIICAPLWHLTDESEYQKLKQVLTSLGSNERIER